ncbi:isoflavone reductase family protein, partial [Polyplosphaeria fusca]
MAKQSILLLGATGETGGDILEGLLEDGSLDVTCLIQPSSASKPVVQALKDRGIKTVIGDLGGDTDALAEVVRGYDTIISAIAAFAQKAQLSLVDAAAKAGTKRFVPCGFTIVCPPEGVMQLREDQEAVRNRIYYHHLPYTIIDVGYWHQLSLPRLSSGRIDSTLLVPRNVIYGSGNTPTMLTDKRDIGRYTALIIRDPRTLNQKVFTHSDNISQNDIIHIVEQKSGEKLALQHLSAEETLQQREAARAAVEGGDATFLSLATRSEMNYNYAKHIRGDNTPEVARYLGYLDARELYPEVRPIGFAEFVEEVLGGKGRRPY